MAVLVAVLGVLLAVAAPVGAQRAAEAQADERSTILHKKLVHGEYVQHLPKQAPKGILVIAHGSTEAGEDVAKLAENFLQRWVKFADEYRLIAVAPVFDANFGSWEKEPGIFLGGGIAASPASRSGPTSSFTTSSSSIGTSWAATGASTCTATRPEPSSPGGTPSAIPTD